MRNRRKIAKRRIISAPAANITYIKIRFPKNEGCTRNFLERGNAAAQAMNFIVIKFEQAKRAMTM